MRRLFARALLAALVVALAAACSSVTRVAYNNAPMAAAWLVDDWFAIDDTQREWVKERFARLHAWHRASELPAYERLLQDTAARATRGLTEHDARRIFGEMRALWHRLVRQAIPDVADFLLGLRPAQVDLLERRFAEENEKAAREYLKGNARERLEARADRFVDRVEDWTGRLSGPQRDLVRARVTAMGDLTQDWLDDRRRRQAETLALARARPSREAMIAGLTRILVDTDSWRRADYAARLRARDAQVFALIAALDATLTPEQRGRLHRRLAGYAADAAYLAVAGS